MSRVVIPVRVFNGQIMVDVDDGSELPKLKDGTRADIVLSSSNFVNKEDVEDYLQESLETLLEAGSEILFAVKHPYVPEDLICHTIQPENILNYEGCDFVSVVLMDDLKIRVKGFKHGRLEPCKCYIPAFKNHEVYLNDAEQNTLNSAYTVISKHFEPKRKSYGGNVFLNSYFKEDGQWILLEAKRNPLAIISYAGDRHYEY